MSAAERDERQTELMLRGHELNADGDYAGAKRCFLEVYQMGGDPEHMAIARLSAANMSLKMGNVGDHLTREYDDMLRSSANLPPALVETMVRKRGESVSQRDSPR